MKKYFFFAAAAIAISSCTQQEVVDEPKGAAIGFDTFVGKSTRATDTDNSNFTSFYVYGSYDLSGTTTNVFNGEKVTGSVGNSWTYSPLRYWVDDATYKFAAATAEGTYNYSANSLTFTNYTVSGEDDLVIANTDNPTNESTVAFSFKHALSKIEITFTSTFDQQYTVSISDVKVNGVKNQGTATATSTSITWASQTGEEAFEFDDVTINMSGATDGAASADPVTQFLLPQEIAEEDLTLTFTVDVPNFPVDETERNITVKIPAGEWEVGNVYNYKLTLNAGNVYELEPIEFEVTEVSSWDNPKDIDLQEQTLTSTEAGN